MKKLALALVCFASVAFFASCVKTIDNPEPSIAVLTGENYVYDGQTLDLNTDYQIGFRVASNSQTMKELATFQYNAKLYDLDNVLQDEQNNTVTISGTEYVFEQGVNFSIDRELIGKAEFTGTVTDADGKTNSVTLTVNLNQPAVVLAVEDITWVKTAHNAQDLSAYGLFWKETNYKSPFTHILPAEGSTLYLVANGDRDFDRILTDVDLSNYFSNLVETSTPIQDYKNVDCNQSANYNDLLVCKDANGNIHAINILRADITTPAAGTRITITGKAK